MTLTDIIPLVRYLINDNLTSTGTDIFTYNVSNVFTLTEANVSAVNDVAVNDVSSSTTYTFNSTTNKITVTSVLTSGDIVEIDYSYYANYSDTEIENHIRGAIIHLSTNNYYTFQDDPDDKEIYPDPTLGEKNLIALTTAILIEPDNRTYRLPDISITMPPGSLPTADKISKAIASFKKNTHGVFFLSSE